MITSKKPKLLFIPELSRELLYYTYLLLDPRKQGKFQFGLLKLKFEPFYCGKGTGDRAWTHATKILAGKHSHNLHLAFKIKKIFRETGLKAHRGYCS